MPIFPIDRSQVYFVGHSMGAGQLIQQVQFSPKLPIAVAAMGGGQRVGSWAKESTPAWFVAAVKETWKAWSTGTSFIT